MNFPRKLLLFLSAPLAAVLAFVGCGTTDVWVYSCLDFEHGHKGPDGGPDPCHYADNPDDAVPDAGPDTGADAAALEGCPPNACVLRDSSWDGPMWLWSGPPDQKPACPSGPYQPGESTWEGGEVPVAPVDCEPCDCEASVGSCVLPSELTASTVACYQPGGTSISFDAPMSWEGACDSTTSIPAGMVKSLTIPPLTVVEEGCMPILDRVPALTPKPVPWSWETVALACHGQGWLPCGDPLATCIPPDAAPPPGFLLCLQTKGEIDCPTKWPNQKIFYHGIQDNRTCSECTCGPPQGSMCTAQVYSYTDAACSLPVDPGWTISSASQKCIDIQPPGQALMSKSATPPTYLRGTCAPGGGAGAGAVVESDPVTFCCK